MVSAQTDDGEEVGRLLVLEGRAWYMDRDLVRAQAVLVKAAKLDPQSASAFRWLGAVLLERADTTRAARALERAAQLAPGDPEVLVLLDRALGPALRAPAAARPVHAAQPAARRVEPAAPPRVAPVAPRAIAPKRSRRRQCASKRSRRARSHCRVLQHRCRHRRFRDPRSSSDPAEAGDQRHGTAGRLSRSATCAAGHGVCGPRY